MIKGHLIILHPVSHAYKKRVVNLTQIYATLPVLIQDQLSCSDVVREVILGLRDEGQGVCLFSDCVYLLIGGLVVPILYVCLYSLVKK